MGVAAAIGVGVAAGSAGAGIFSSIFGANAASKQAKYTADKAQETAYTLDARQRADLAPFRQYGITAGNTLMGMLTGERDVSSALQESPLFKFQSELGNRDINRQLAARGLQGSGAGLETLARFSNQLVAEEGNRFYDRLFNMTALGANAGARMATNTASTAGSLIGAQTQIGMAQAGIQGQMYNQIGGNLQGFAKDVMGLPMYNASLRYMNSMSGGGGGSFAPTSSYGSGVTGFNSGGSNFLVNQPLSLAG
jgi:hypothetical protein